MGQIGFLHIGIDPDIAGRDQRHRAGIGQRRGLGDQISAGLQRIDLGHHAVERRAHHGVIELALRLFDLRLDLQILRMLRDVEIRIAAEPGELDLRKLTQRFELALVAIEGEVRLVVGGLSDGVGLQQRRIAGERGLIQFDLRLLRGNVLLHAHVVLLHCLQRQRGLRQTGLGIVQRDLELPRVDAEQYIAGLDRLAFTHIDFADQTRNVGRHHQLGGVDIGVVSRNVAAAKKIEPKSGDHGDDRHDDEKDEAHALAQRIGERRRARSWRLEARRQFKDGFSHSGGLPRAPGAGRCWIAWRKFSFTTANWATICSTLSRETPASAVVIMSSPSAPSRSSMGRAAAVKNNRLARRSLGSERRSIRPLSQRRSSRRVNVIGCRSSISASSDCFSPSKRSSRTSTAHCALVTPNWAPR